MPYGDAPPLVRDNVLQLGLVDSSTPTWVWVLATAPDEDPFNKCGGAQIWPPLLALVASVVDGRVVVCGSTDPGKVPLTATCGEHQWRRTHVAVICGL
jgi:hypothetical protein